MKHQVKAKAIKEISTEAVENRLNKMKYYKRIVIDKVLETSYEEVLLNGLTFINENGEQDHINPVHLMKGNDKTGTQCWTISFIPILDCPNCSGCARLCYDIRNDCIYTDTLKARAINSALRELCPERFWQRVGELVEENFVEQLRINVGGDLRYEDFDLIHNYIAFSHPSCDVLFFTKNYEGLNKWLDDVHGIYVSNYHPLMSGWKDMPCDNRYHLPMSHVLFADGTSDSYLPEYGAYYCGGNCTACHFKKEGCWVLNENEHVVFLAH